MAENNSSTAGDPPPRNETRFERADRNFSEILQELRVTQTGVQILFAFLLTLAFTERFPSLDTVQRATYVTTLLLAVLAAALFTAPAAVHRTLFGQHSKPLIVRVSSRLAGIGMTVLVFALAGSVLLVVDVAVGRTGGIIASAGTLVMCAGLWGLLPRLVRASDRGRDKDRDRGSDRGSDTPDDVTPSGPR
ncbi:DUF6328 family protein [Streptomyces rectiviolaceus]|uniref:Integral membrane protein n=1 Tax=Streptomyces rectiviolaceus TaxID=332591 RepID=A0ABP6N2I2_9ACTN